MSSTQQQQTPVFFSVEDVLKNSPCTFFWVGRGGYAITHSGNAQVRTVIANNAAEYLDTKRSHRGQFARNLLQTELAHVKFVVPRDALLANLDADDKKAACGLKFVRKVGEKRREGLLAVHQSMDQIRSYPDNVCIEVGQVWTLDILNHMLREDMDGSKRSTPTSRTSTDCDSTSTGKKRSNKEITTTAPENEFDRILDVPLSDLVVGLDKEQSLDDLFATLFPEEAGSEAESEVESESPSPKKQRTLSLTSDFNEVIDMDSLEEAATLDYFDSMFTSGEFVEALLAA